MNNTNVDNLINILKDGNISIPKYIFFNYKKLSITDSEFIIIMYLISNGNNVLYNPKVIGSELNLKVIEVLEVINSLSEKLLLNIDIIKNSNGIMEERINLDNLYKKLSNVLIENINTSKVNDIKIFKKFESEFGRLLSPIEYELINGWLNNKFSEELILEALKEAVYNGVTNLRYIDKILFEWNKKGIKNKNDISIKNKKVPKKNIETIDFNWLE